MKKVTKVEWVITAEDGFPSEVTTNDFIVKTDDEIRYRVHFARNLEDIYIALKKEPKTYWEKIYFPDIGYDEKIEVFKDGFFFIIDEDPDGPDGYGYKAIFIQDPKRITAWAELI